MRYFCYHPGPNLDTLHWMFKKKIKWWGMDTGSCDHPMNTSIRYMRPELADEFTKKHGKTPGEFFGTFHYTTSDPAGRRRRTCFRSTTGRSRKGCCMPRTSAATSS